MKNELTEREQEVYSFIVDFRRDRRFSPSMREITSALCYASVSTVHRHIHSLIDKGWLMPVERGNRMLVPKDDGGQ